MRTQAKLTHWSFYIPSGEDYGVHHQYNKALRIPHRRFPSTVLVRYSDGDSKKIESFDPKPAPNAVDDRISSRMQSLVHLHRDQGGVADHLHYGQHLPLLSWNNSRRTEP